MSKLVDWTSSDISPFIGGDLRVVDWLGGATSEQVLPFPSHPLNANLSMLVMYFTPFNSEPL